MNKSLEENDSDPFVQAHKRSLGVLMKIFKIFWKSNETLSEVAETWVVMW